MFSALLLALAVTGQTRNYNLLKSRVEITPGVHVNTNDVVAKAPASARAQVRTLTQIRPVIVEMNPRYASRPYPTAEPGPPMSSYATGGSVYSATPAQYSTGGSCYSGSAQAYSAAPAPYATGGSCYSGAAQTYSAAPPAQYSTGGSCYSSSAQAYSAAPPAQYSTGGSCYSGSSQAPYSAAPYSSPMVYSAPTTYAGAPVTYAVAPTVYRAPMTYAAPMQSYGSLPIAYPIGGGGGGFSGSLPIAYPIGGMGGFSGMSSGGITCLSGTCQ